MIFLSLQTLLCGNRLLPVFITRAETVSLGLKTVSLTWNICCMDEIFMSFQKLSRNIYWHTDKSSFEILDKLYHC